MSATAASSRADRPSTDGIVDAHMHVWRADRAAYPWLADVPSISRTFDVADVADEQAVVGVTDVVLVQAADNVDDTENMLRAAQRYAQVAGVVAWVPLREPDGTEALLDRWRHERIVGVRHLVHRDPDPNFLRDPAVNEVLDLLSGRGLAFDVCAETTHLLGLIPGLAERHPQLTLVVDHLGKPPIRERGWEPWASRLADAAEAPNVVAKLSGLNTAAAPGATRDDYAPYVEHALDVFGPDRVMYGGDWPFALLAAASYQQIWEPLRGCLDALDVGARHAVLAGTARRAYRLAR